MRHRLFAQFLLLSFAQLSLASTLDPGHPVWTRAGIDHAGLREFIQRSRIEGPRPAWPRDGRAAKGLGAYGVRLLVIPVYYSDESLPIGPSTETLQGRFFGAQSNSVRNYWEVASGGRFQLRGEVLPWQKLPERLARYRNVLDGNLVGNGLAGPRELVRDALREIADDWDLHAYDDDGADGIAGSGDDDGFVDLLLVLHPDPGFENDPSPSGPAMLAHSSFLNAVDPILLEHGIQGGNYALASAQGPLGVWVHEMGHLLGLDDLYDLRVVGSLEAQPHRGGLGLWSLMAHGTWGGAGETPSALDAYSRRRLGWEDGESWDVKRSLALPTAGVGTNRSVALRPFGDWEREYFLVERRQRNPGGIVDGGLPGGGILLYQVDAARTLADDHDAPRVRLLQADGRDDLGDLANNGDAGDPFVDAVSLDGSSSPALTSVRPSPARPSPRLDIGAPVGDEQGLDFWPSQSPQLALKQADFDFSPVRRALLAPSDEQEWGLRFAEMGPSPGSASLDTISVDSRLVFANDFPVTLTLQNGDWLPAQPVIVRSRSLQAQPDAPRIRWRLSVDGNHREFEFGLPVAHFEGLSGDDFYRWQAEVRFAATDTTRFELLGLDDLPANSTSGWGLSTDGSAGYANRVEAGLTSPWFAAPLDGVVRLWSDAFSESAGPGECYDGGVLEIQFADQPWQALTPSGWGLSYVRAMSSSPTGDAIGFGGDDAGWRSYEALLPATTRPLRLRLRFGSNSIWHDGHWAIAGLGTSPEPLHANMLLSPQLDGSWAAEIALRGDASGLNNHEIRLFWRRPADDAWQPLDSWQRLVPGEDQARLVFTAPADVQVVQMGLFVQTLQASTEPPLLLALGGFRNLVAAGGGLRLLGNPARLRASFELPSSTRARHLIVYDLRGRRLRRLAFAAGARRVHWDGRDEAGTLVASGRYFVVVEEDPSQLVALTWIK